MAVSTKEPRLQKLEVPGLIWVYIEKPTQAEMQLLAQAYPRFHPLNLEDVLTRLHRPKVDEYPDHLFLVFHFPVFDKESRMSHASEVDVFIGRDFLVTVHCDADLRPLRSFFNECRANEELRHKFMDRGSGYLLYEVLSRLLDACFPMLDKVLGNVEKVEDMVLANPSPAQIQELSYLRRDILSFRRIVGPQRMIIENLETKERPYLGKGLADYFGDLADHIYRIRDGLEDAKEVVEGLYDTSRSLTSHRINEVMRVLTIITTIMLPLSVLSGIYGMNLRLPLGDHPYSFLFVILLMALIAGGMLAFFRWRRWL